MTDGPAALQVVLVNYRSLENLSARMRSAALAGADVVVVDNASDPDAVADLCRRTGARAVLNPTNRGFAHGVNAALPHLDETRPVLLLNPDVDLTTTARDRLLAALAEPGTDAVAPLLVEPDGRLQVGAAGGPLTVRAVLAYFLAVSHLLPVRGVFLTRRQSIRADRVDWLCAACLLVAGDAFRRFGPLPEDELVYAEDVAWGTAATRAGATLRLVPDARVGHPHGSSGGSERWVGAFERLLRRRLGPVRGGVAVAGMRLGLAARRALGRRVT